MYISAAEICILVREMYISRREIKFIGCVNRFSGLGESVSLPLLAFFSLMLGEEKTCLILYMSHPSICPLPTGERLEV